jgi:hypothetical protein
VSSSAGSAASLAVGSARPGAYTGTHHRATVAHTLVVASGLVIDKGGYWFWGRPSPWQLWADLQDLLRRTKADFDPTTDEARAAWLAANAPEPARG